DELPPELRGEPPPRASDEGHGGASNEHQRILSALRQAGGHKGKAAELLGINRTTLWRKLREHKIGY
ncbi:MAG: helix-turn-helix domain-containing protein, partial [Myxococcales bacterium]|nr:helix-turn-helix domain-containing protein [Myxococcales bacterium]